MIIKNCSTWTLSAAHSCSLTLKYPKLVFCTIDFGFFYVKIEKLSTSRFNTSKANKVRD